MALSIISALTFSYVQTAQSTSKQYVLRRSAH